MSSGRVCGTGTSYWAHLQRMHFSKRHVSQQVLVEAGAACRIVEILTDTQEAVLTSAKAVLSQIAGAKWCPQLNLNGTVLQWPPVEAR